MARRKRKTPPRDSKGHFIKGGRKRARRSSKARDISISAKRKSLKYKPRRRKLYRDSKGHFTDQRPRERGKRTAPATHHNRKRRRRQLTSGKFTTKRSRPKRHRKHSGHRVSAKRRAAGLKAARTRKRNKSMGTTSHRRLSPGPKRKKHRKGRKSGLRRSHNRGFHHGGQKTRKRSRGKHLSNAQLAAKVRKYQAERRARGLPEAFDNPISPLDALAVFLVGGAGALAGFATDTFLATHALTAPAAAGGAFTDAPGALQVYDSDAPNTPMWSSWYRLAAGVGGPFVLGFVGAFKMMSPVQTGLRTFALGWGIMSGKKLLTDAGAKFLGKTAIGQRLFGNEIAAQNALAAVTAAGTTKKLNAVTLNNQIPGTPIHYQFGAAGVPKGQMGAGTPCTSCGGMGHNVALHQQQPPQNPPPGYGKPEAPPPPPRHTMEKPPQEAKPADKLPPLFNSNGAPKAPNFNRYDND